MNMCIYIYIYVLLNNSNIAMTTNGYINNKPSLFVAFGSAH